MTVAFPQLELRCDRCKHHWRDHGLNQCRVSKVKWDCEAQALVKVSECGCKWYVGELPPAEKQQACPHEVADQAEGKSQRKVCVHCGVKVK